jgi:mono/diheme cytochrome c family protein
MRSSGKARRGQCGKSVGTAMPAFKDKLEPAEIWKIVALRAGFPKE